MKRIGLVGATGAVGLEVQKLIKQLKLPYKELRLLASQKSGGVETTCGFVQELIPDSFNGLDVAIFSAGADISQKFAPEAVKRGCIVIDNSAAFRQKPEVPLIIPEINASDLKNHRGIISNPNCCTTIALMALAPLHQAFGLSRFFASTYQAVSGTGLAAIKELDSQIRAWSANQELIPSVYPAPIAFNVIPKVEDFSESGYTQEENKMLFESRKILHLPQLSVSSTCVRVPVFRCHSIAINAEFEKPIDLPTAKKALLDFSGLEFLENQLPMPSLSSEKTSCFVGRLRKDSAFCNGLSLWVVGDQLWKGAALNALQILSLL
ncbi:MAG: aspartate-semialdehyde dehydrogenase [Verrucomicrobia bacterium GWC2_42_7]|nr:MAG: aspartate-semialdehyde dehydrogenase [Verrucomicrobia bacterium GWC2_42_7]